VEGSSPDAQAVSEALALLQEYLSDQVPPLFFADSIEPLLRLPAELVAGEIRAWIAAQYRGATALPISDYLFHAAKKVHLLKELQLVAGPSLEAFSKGLFDILLEICPEEDRDSLKDDLQHLDESQTVLATAVEMLHRRSDEEAEEDSGPPLRSDSAIATQPRPPSAPVAHEKASLPAGVAQGLRRLGLLLDRLEREASSAANQEPDAPPAPGPAAAPAATAVASEALVEAVTSSRTPQELEAHLAGLRRLGVGTSPERIFRLLGERLPNWAPPSPGHAQEGETPAPEEGSARAVRQMMDLAADPAESARRYGDLVRAAAEQFNAGSLGRAVTMFDLAGRMAAEKKLPPSVTKTVKERGFDTLSGELLRTFSAQEDAHPLLRRVLSFFTDLSPEALLGHLEEEPARERRRLLLGLLVAHGETARTRALEMLRASLSGASDHSWQLERNLLHLLRIMPRGQDADANAEIDVLLRASEPGGPLPVVREAVAALGQIRHPRAEQTLLARLSELETALSGERKLPYEREEIRGLLDRVVPALARLPSRDARRAVAAHALKRHSALGDTLARAAELGTQNLADDPELLARLQAALRDELPGKLLGITLRSERRARTIDGLVALLEGTTSPQVRELFADIVRRFPALACAQRASRALARREDEAPHPQEAHTLTGDLALLGLPNLLQNLGESQLTGVLTLLDAAGETAGSISLSGGLVVAARRGPLGGPTAVYDLLERQKAVRFVFVRAADGAPPAADPGGSPMSVMGLVMEGMRRFDELCRATALVPDDARFRASARKPSRHPDEPDVQLTRQAWLKAVAGSTPAECEREIHQDAFRVRRLLEHWVEEGSLERRQGSS
jgi:hypothetical protein